MDSTAIFSTFGLFVTLAITLSVVLALIVLLPWLRPRTGLDNQLIKVNIDVFKDRLAELSADYQAGAIDASSYQTQKTELERQLLQATYEQDDTLLPANKKSRLIILIWLPLLMAMGYVLVADRSSVYTLWQAEDSVGQVADDLLTSKIDAPPDWATKDSVALISAMQTNVYRHAYDPDRWVRLAELFGSLQADQQAVEALSRAHRLDPQNDAIATAYAQSSFFANGGMLDADSHKVLQGVLMRHPDHQGAQMLMAMGEARAGNYEVAQAWVRKLRANIANKSGDHSAALASLDELSETIRGQQQMAETQKQSQKSYEVAVSVNSNLLPLIHESDVLFVSIRDVNGGPPFAAVRLPAGQLQQGGITTVQIGDQDAMMAGRDLSSAINQGLKLVVSATISASGQAISQSGDLSATPIPLQDDGNQINIEINQQIP
ncbi:c-type cytochrome biogenesis protein CcmI [Psychrobacter sp. I-STPA10]|uniref:c-type cytochrome biogenesis protein CcmI n=1 Tax=Psychrobacter sp. I-STPA10 TaxID=2585769 RepID=UPI001E5C282D|nr:c-type cytochrome biogenesis protein CcmI [Psychrobacter sp. I-STPA10]